MKFTGRDEHFRTSVDGNWRIARVVIDGTLTRYEVWRKSREGWLLVKANQVSFEEAQAFCRAEVFGEVAA